MSAVTRALARFLVDARSESIPDAVRHEASRALLNWLGCAIGGARHETTERMLAALAGVTGTGQAAVVGRAERLDILHTALVNGTSSHVLDFDDTHARTVHPSAPVLPALLALAELRGMSGAQLVHAFVLAVEAECRIGLSVFPEHYDSGWHITGTAGVFGAAAGAAKLLGLDVQRTAWALGIAATQSAGLQEMFGTMCKSLHPGLAARNGLTAALLAEQGFSSSERAIEAPRGFARVLSPRFDPGVITRGLGTTWELAQNMYKPYACGLWLHATIDGCIQLKREYDLRPDDIERVEVRAGPLVLELTGKRVPRNGLEGKFSVYHAAAAALISGAAGEAQFSDAIVNDAGVVALRGRVSATADAAVRKLEAFVTVHLRSGVALAKHVEHALGSRERPMTDRDLEDKFRELSAGVLSRQRADAVIASCWNVTQLRDVGELARASTPDF